MWRRSTHTLSSIRISPGIAHLFIRPNVAHKVGPRLLAAGTLSSTFLAFSRVQTMMDPVSVFAIVSAAGNLAFKSGKVVQTLYELAEKYKQAEVTILSIIQECRTIELAWTRIERWAENGLDDYHDYEQLAERLQLSLYSGQLVMNELEKDLAALQTSPQFSKFRRKAKIVWNDRLLQDHQNRIRGQVCAMLLLLEVIQL